MAAPGPRSWGLPDKAVAEACVSCHNDHEDTPKRDFKLDDVMGGVVVRIGLEP